MLLTKDWQQFTPTIDTLISNPTQEQVFFKTTIDQVEPMLLIGEDTLFIKANYTVWLKANTRLNVSVSSNTDKIENMYRVGDFGADVGDINNTTGTTGITLFTNLQDTPNDYENQANKFLAVNETEDGIAFVELDVNEVPDYTPDDRNKVLAIDDNGIPIWKELVYECKNNTFIRLNDTPSYYEANKVVAVNSTGDGITYVDVAEIANAVPDTDGHTDGEVLTIVDGTPTWSSETDDFISLTDTPNYYDNGKFVKVDDNDNKIIYSTVREVPNPEPSDENKVLTVQSGSFVWDETNVSNKNFTELKDVPQSYSGYAGKVVAVKQTEDGLEFVEVSSSDIPEYTEDDNGKVLSVDNSGNLVWQELTITTDFKSLTDTEDYTDQANKLVIVNQDGTGLTYIDQPNDCSVINIIPEIQTQLYPSQVLTNQDIQNMIDARIQLLETIEPEGNIGVIYKCIRPDAGEVYPINKGIIEYISENNNRNYHLKLLSNGLFIARFYIFELDENGDYITTRLTDDADNWVDWKCATPNLLRLVDYSGYIYDFDRIEDDKRIYIKRDDLDTVGTLECNVCGSHFLSYVTYSGYSIKITYKYFTPTSGTDALSKDVYASLSNIDLSNGAHGDNTLYCDYVSSIASPNNPFEIYCAIRTYYVDDGTAYFQYGIVKININYVDFSVENVELIHNFNYNGTNSQYIYLMAKSQDDNIFFMYCSVLPNNGNKGFILVKTDEGYESIKNDIDKGEYTLKWAIDDKNNILIVHGYGDTYFYKLNLKPSLICMADKVAEVSDTFDLSTWTSSASKIRYASNIGSNQTEFDIAVADGQILRFISLLDNEEKRNVDCGSNITWLESKLGKTIVVLENKFIKIYDNSNGNELYSYDYSDYTSVYRAYLFTDGIDIIGFGVSLNVGGGDNPYQFERNDLQRNTIYIIDNTDVTIYLLDSKEEFVYKMIATNSSYSDDDTVWILYRFDASNGEYVDNSGDIVFDGVEYSIMDIHSNGNNLLVNVNDINDDSKHTLLLCIEDLENIKVTNNELTYGISNDFKLTTNTYNCLVLEDGSTLKNVNYK